MPVLRPSTIVRASRALPSSSSSSLPVAVRGFASSQAVRGGAEHAHEEHYDAPGGWLFGVKPGEKYQKEGWETIWYWGFFGSLGLGVVGYVFKPDTSIQTWALEEARRRLEAEGILKEPESKS